MSPRYRRYYAMHCVKLPSDLSVFDTKQLDNSGHTKVDRGTLQDRYGPDFGSDLNETNPRGCRLLSKVELAEHM